MTAFRYRCLSQNILAIVQASKGEGSLCIIHSESVYFNKIFSNFLLKFELSTFKRITFLINLVDFNLIGESNDIVVIGMAFTFFLFALVIHIRVIGVFKVCFVNISLVSDVCVSLQYRSEVYVDFCLIKTFICDLLFPIFPGPSQVNSKLLVSIRCQFISNIFFFRTACFLDGYSGNLVELQSVLKFIIEGNIVMLIICYVVCKDCSQTIWDFITNIIVRRILPTRSISRGIINILNLFEEIRLV